MAECPCGGQHIGCEISSASGQYECVCGGNTMGEYCQECMPFYNQHSYREGIPCEGKCLLSHFFLPFHPYSYYKDTANISQYPEIEFQPSM